MNNGDTHTYVLHDIDLVCFFCLMRDCRPSDSLCLHRRFNSLREMEKAGPIDWERVEKRVKRRTGARV